MKRFYDFLDALDAKLAACICALIILTAGFFVAPGCSTAARERQLGYTLSGLVAAQATLDAYVGPHELGIVKSCTPDDKAGCEAKVHAFQLSRDKARADLRGALDLVGAAYKANSDPAVATAEAAAAAAFAFLKQLGVAL